MSNSAIDSEFGIGWLPQTTSREAISSASMSLDLKKRLAQRQTELAIVTALSIRLNTDPIQVLRTFFTEKILVIMREAYDLGPNDYNVEVTSDVKTGDYVVSIQVSTQSKQHLLQRLENDRSAFGIATKKVADQLLIIVKEMGPGVSLCSINTHSLNQFTWDMTLKLDRNLIQSNESKLPLIDLLQLLDGVGSIQTQLQLIRESTVKQISNKIEELISRDELLQLVESTLELTRNNTILKYGWEDGQETGMKPALRLIVVGDGNTTFIDQQYRDCITLLESYMEKITGINFTLNWSRSQLIARHDHKRGKNKGKFSVGWFDFVFNISDSE